MKALKLATIVAVAALATGCATNSDIEQLQSQINVLKTDVANATSSADSASRAAADAASRAASAEAAANRAARSAEEVNDKLDRMFHKSMMK